MARGLGLSQKYVVRLCANSCKQYVVGLCANSCKQY